MKRLIETQLIWVGAGLVLLELLLSKIVFRACFEVSLLVMRPFFALRQKKPLHTGVRTGCHYLIFLSVCVTFVVFTDCESCTRPISTNRASMEAGKHGLTRGARFVTVCLEVVAVAGLMWVSWCASGEVGFFYLL